MKTATYPIQEMRAQFPALNRTYNEQTIGYFDGPGGSQVAKMVIDEMARYMENGVANLGRYSSTSKETMELVQKAREYAAVLLGAQPDEISFGANMTTLAFTVSRAISRTWEYAKGNIVVTEIDHHANIDPWITAATDKGLDIHKITLNPDSLLLNTENLDDLITNETKLVAVGLASNAVGTINNISDIVKRAREVGALVAVDGVHAVPHFKVNFEKLDVDFLFCSAYKFFGPHVGIAAIKTPVFEQLEAYRLQPAPQTAPQKLETGTQNFEGLVGVIQAIEFLASFGEGDTLEKRLINSYEKMESYENELAKRLREGLSQIEGVTLYQAPDSEYKTPTVAFTVDGVPSSDVCFELVEQYSLHLESGDFYAMTLVEKLNTGEGGVIRAGIAPYNTMEEIERLISAIKMIAHTSNP